MRCKRGDHDLTLPNARTADGRCRECRKLRNRVYDKSAKGKVRRRRENFKRRHSIAVPDGLYDQFFNAQDGRCAICGTPACATGSGFALDHCHKTGAFRGLLCNRCNVTIAKFDDDPVQLELFGRNAARYVTRCKA